VNQCALLIKNKCVEWAFYSEMWCRTGRNLIKPSLVPTQLKLSASFNINKFCLNFDRARRQKIWFQTLKLWAAGWPKIKYHFTLWNWAKVPGIHIFTICYSELKWLSKTDNRIHIVTVAHLALACGSKLIFLLLSYLDIGGTTQYSAHPKIVVVWILKVVLKLNGQLCRHVLNSGPVFSSFWMVKTSWWL
jgi:hypothetical protein